MSPGVTPQYAEFRRQQILAAAWRAFAKKGIRGATIRDIAQSIGLSTGVVYSYFESKEEIISALQQKSIAQNRLLLDQLARKETVTDAIVGLFGHYLECCSEEQLRESSRGNLRYWTEALERADFRQGMISLTEHLREGLAAIVKRGVRRRELPDDLDPAAFAELILAILCGLHVQVCLVKDSDPAAYVRALREALLLLIRQPDTVGSTGRGNRT